jgi:hypothetical protein
MTEVKVYTRREMVERVDEKYVESFDNGNDLALYFFLPMNENNPNILVLYLYNEFKIFGPKLNWEVQLAEGLKILKED